MFSSATCMYCLLLNFAASHCSESSVRCVRNDVVSCEYTHDVCDGHVVCDNVAAEDECTGMSN